MSAAKQKKDLPPLDLATRGSEYVGCTCTACKSFPVERAFSEMSLALQCSRCGQCYDPETGEAL